MQEINEKVLVVEDDRAIREFICYALETNGFRPIESYGVVDAQEKLRMRNPDIMVLDLGLPDGDGMDFIRKLRTTSAIPIIVVSARDDDADKVKALDAGAEDYLTKPFAAAELLARVRVLRRHLLTERRNRRDEIVSVRDLSINLDTHEVRLDGANVRLSPMEYQLLALLAQNIGKVMMTRTILDTLYGADYGNDTQALRALMAGLRRKIEKSPGKPKYIVTEIGVGYRLLDE